MPLPAIAGYLAETAGSWALNRLLQKMLPNQNTPYTKGVNQGMQYGQDLMPELYSEAMGKPSAATKVTYANVSDEINRLQQSYASSAQRSTPAMTSLSTPVREGQARFGETKVRAYADILGNAQQNAQNQIMSQYGKAQAGQLALEMQNRQDADNLATSLSGIITRYKKLKMSGNDPLVNNTLKPYLQWLIDRISGKGGSLPTPENSSPSGFVMPNQQGLML